MFRTRRPYRSLAVALLVGYLLIMAGYVWIAGWAVAAGHLTSTGHWHGSFGQMLLPRINDVVVFTFFLVCGASVGSFLNVVVWRMPQGMSVNGHSFCPRCRNTLRVRDNVPVFGWLWLGGRCRDCRLPISSRYPIVEATLGVAFALIGTVEMYGWNLPYRWQGGSYAYASPMIGAGQLGIVAYHLGGVSIAWAMSLIRYDRNAIPAKLVTFAAVWLMGGILLFPSLAIVPWQLAIDADGFRPGRFPGLGGWPPPDGFILSGWLGMSDHGGVGFDASGGVQALVRVLTALVAAAFFARVLARAFCPKADLKLDPLGAATGRLLDLVRIIAVVSLLVGWQATSGVLVLASLLACVLPTALSRTDALGRFSLALAVTLTVQILFWRPLSQSGWWPSEQSGRGVLLSFGAATLLIPIWLRETRGNRTQRATEEVNSIAAQADLSQPGPADQ